VLVVTLFVIWLALIIVLGFLAINFNSLDRAQWEQIVIHLIVLMSIVIISEFKIATSECHR